MRRRTLTLIVPALVIALAISFVTVLPVTSQDTNLITDKLNQLYNKLEDEKPTLQNKVNAVIHQIESGAFKGAVNKLENDVKKSITAWVEEPEELIKLVDEIIDLIKGITPPPPPTPDFEISTPPYQLDVLQGGFNTTIITITSTNNFNQEVTLVATTSASEVTLALDPATLLPLPNATLTSTLKVDATLTTAPGEYEINVTGRSGLLEHSVIIPLKIIEFTPPPPPDFTMSASPTALTIEQGRSNASVITVTSINGFDEQVDLTVSSPPISGVNATLNPDKVSPQSGSFAISVLILDLADDAIIGTHNITVTGESGVLQHSINITLAIIAPPVPPTPDFSVNAYPLTLIIEQGDATTSTIVVTSLRGFSELVELTLKPESISGVTLSLDPIQVTPSPDDFATSTLRIDVAKDAASNEYDITVTGTSGSLQRSVGISLKVIIEKKPPKIVSVSRTPATTPAYNETVIVFANVVDFESGVREATLRYSRDAVLEDIVMTLSAGLYQATIPAFPYGTTVEYSVEASDNAGNLAVSDSATYIIADPYKPLMSTPIWTPQDPIVNEDTVINVTVIEPEGASGIDGVILRYSNSTAVYSIPMTDNHDGNWTAVISNQTGPKVVFLIEALDKAGNTAESEMLEFNVTTPAFPLIWILAAIAILAAATGGGAYYVRRKRKRGTTATSVPSAAIKPVPPHRV